MLTVGVIMLLIQGTALKIIPLIQNGWRNTLCLRQKNTDAVLYIFIDKDNSLKEELEGQEKDASSLLEFRYIYGIDEVER